MSNNAASAVPFPFSADAGGHPKRNQDGEPTGTITVDGSPMAFWLPAGVTPESLGLTRRHDAAGHRDSRRRDK